MHRGTLFWGTMSDIWYDYNHEQENRPSSTHINRGTETFYRGLGDLAHIMSDLIRLTIASLRLTLIPHVLAYGAEEHLHQKSTYIHLHYLI